VCCGGTHFIKNSPQSKRFYLGFDSAVGSNKIIDNFFKNTIMALGILEKIYKTARLILERLDNLESSHKLAEDEIIVKINVTKNYSAEFVAAYTGLQIKEVAQIFVSKFETKELYEGSQILKYMKKANVESEEKIILSEPLQTKTESTKQKKDSSKKVSIKEQKAFDELIEMNKELN